MFAQEEQEALNFSKHPWSLFGPYPRTLRLAPYPF
jgi:hypothetical protein